MMRLVPPPADWDCVTDFDEIIAHKRNDKDKSILEGIRGAIAESYRAYREQAPEFTFEPQPFSAEQGRALQNCYKRNLRVAACKSMLARLEHLNSDRFACPLCGIGEHSTWDHYLPQAMFPEFAVCVYNLIRSCAKCNEGRKNWRGPEGRLILHMYYDNFVQDQILLDAQVNVIDGKIHVEYQMRNLADVSAPAQPFARQFARHCRELGLLPRFAGAARDCLYDHVDDLTVRVDRAAIQAGLERTAQSRARRHGTNHWQAALFRGAASSPSFLEYILQRAES